MKNKLILFSLLLMSFYMNAQNDSIFVSEDKFEEHIQLLTNRLTNDFNKRINETNIILFRRLHFSDRCR